MLHAFGDESADEKGERVFAVAAVIGTDDEWSVTMREWFRRTRGLPFHATDCEAVRGDEREASLRLYRDLTQILATSPLAGFAIAMNLSEYRSVFGIAYPDKWKYGFVLQRLVQSMATTARTFNARRDEEAVTLAFTFDSRPKGNGDVRRLYSAVAGQREWRSTGIFSTNIKFEGHGEGATTPKNPRLELADLLARESMKEMDRAVTGVPARQRISYAVLAETKKFQFIELRTEFWRSLNAAIQNSPDVTRFQTWLVKEGRAKPDGIPQLLDCCDFLAELDKSDEPVVA